MTDIDPSINDTTWRAALKKAFIEYHSPQTVHENTLTSEWCLSNPDIKKLYENYTSWDWNYGYSPKFTNQFETKFTWGMVDINVNVEKGIIIDG